MAETMHAPGNNAESLRGLLARLPVPFARDGKVGIKIHWGEKGNKAFLQPEYTREIVRWVAQNGGVPFVFDTTVLYSGGRRDGRKSLETATAHGFTEQYLGCPVRIGDGPDGRDTVEIPGAGRHFPTVQVASILQEMDAFVIFSHFKGHLESSFGGAIKNISMGMASRAQKQRMHADAHPVLNPKRCTRCGLCVDVCPAAAATLPPDADPCYDLKRCIGCAQCIALCPEAALKVIWDTDITVFQERLVETAASIWKQIGAKSFLINALIRIVSECDCLPGDHPPIAEDAGFIAGAHPVAVDAASIDWIGTEPFDLAHPGIPWQRQFSYAQEIGFIP